MAVSETGHLASRAIDDLYRKHGAEVYRYAYAVLGNRADAEDVTQTTFLNAYRALEQGVRPRKPSNWLLTIASNAIKQRFRQDQARPRQVELDERIASSEPDDDGPSIGELLTALSKIPPQQRQAIVLREFEGRSYAEIADILGVTTSALETLLFRARRSLAEELDQQLTCTEAQLAVSRSVDGQLGRKERRRLRDHLAECPDCARFARLQPGHRTALRGLLLLPIPLSFSVFKGLEGAGTATAATMPVAAGAGAGAAAMSAGVGTGLGTAGATGGSALIGGVTLKAAAVVAAATVAGGVAVTGASEVDKKPAKTPTAAKPGERLGQIAPRGVLVPGNGIARGKLTAPGQVKTDGAAADAAKAKAARAKGLRAAELRKEKRAAQPRPRQTKPNTKTEKAPPAAKARAKGTTRAPRQQQTRTARPENQPKAEQHPAPQQASPQPQAQPENEPAPTGTEEPTVVEEPAPTDSASPGSEPTKGHGSKR